MTLINLIAAISPLTVAIWSTKAVFRYRRVGGLHFWSIGRFGGSVYWRRKP